MPIYEYRCSGCGHELEALQKLSEAPLTACPECGKPTLTKLMSAAGFQLKGSGWYATDFKSSGSKPAAKADAAKDGDGGGASKPAEAKSESSSESKSAATTEKASTSGGSCGGNCSCH